MLWLADTSIRQYRKKNGATSLRLRSYLMVESPNIGFSLRAYLKNIACTLTLPSGEKIALRPVKYSIECAYEMDTMVHDFWASAVTNIKTIEHVVGTLRLDYHISFTGHPYEEPTFLETVVPLIDRT